MKPWLTALPATLLSAALFYLSQGLDDLWFLAWVAPAPILWLAYGAGPRWSVALASLVAFAGGMAFLVQCYAPIVPLPVLGIELVTLSPSLLAFPVVVLFARFAERRLPPLAALLAFPAAWAGVEYLISLVSLHGAFVSFANSQISAPVVLQGASLLGMFVISFLICLCANALALAARRKPGVLVAAAVGLALCAANVVFGVMRLNAPQAPAVRVAAFADHATMMTAYRAGTLEAAVADSTAYADAARAAAGKGARLVVTHEGGVVSTRAWDAAVFAPLVAAAHDTGVIIVAGVLEQKLKADPLSRDADNAVAFYPDGTQRLYAKRHLVPVLEDNFTPGRAAGPLGGDRAMVICKDMDFPRTILADAQASAKTGPGIRLMAAPAGDLTFDAWMHGRVGLLRGVENGFAIVRPANDGLILISDAQGRIVGRERASKTGMSAVIADVSPGPGPTLYTRIGDLFAWLCLGLTVLLGGWAVRRARSAIQ
jgi:apolipoprotein N-acyltransferase